MRVPKRIRDIVERKQLFIDQSRSRLRSSVVRLQSQLLNEILSEIIPALDVRGGVILDTVHNYRLLSDLDNVYKSFNKIAEAMIVARVNTAVGGIGSFAGSYFSMIMSSETGARFDKVLLNTTKKMNLRLGVDGGEIVRGGFLDSVIKNDALGTQLKDFMARTVTSQQQMKDFTRGMNEIITGGGKSGGYERQFERFAYDIYQQYDRAYNKSLADEFDMNYFIYQGGLIEDSRDFCREHNNRVWTRDEAELWAEWTPAKAKFITEFKQKDLNSVPSYLGYAGYDPFVDAGGYNCRHELSWIPDSLAFDLRPELKK